MRGALRHAALLLVISCTLTGCTDGPDAPRPSRAPGTPTGATNEPRAGASGAGDRYYPQDGNGGYDALAYDVRITYDPKAGRLSGDSALTARATQDLSRFNLDLRGLTVRSVEVNTERAEFARKGVHELVITPKKVLPNGARFTVRVRYAGKPGAMKDSEVGRLGWMRAKSGGAYVLGEPHSASFWYPVNETPRDKATFRLTARVPKGWVAVSIGRQGRTTTEGRWTSYRWSDSNPVASYLTTVAIDKFTVEKSTLPDGTPVISAYAPGATGKRALEKRLPSVIKFLSGKFGPYPQTTAGGIYLADDIPFALETQGRPTYASWATLGIVVHEYAHQWYGNSVSLRSWADICLNECIASYAQWMWAKHADSADLDQRYRDAVADLRANREFWSRKLFAMGAGNEFEGVYDKGILAMHALRRKVGERVFNAVLREFARTHRDGNTTWPEFERAIERKAGKDLDEFYAAWFRGTGIPSEAHLYPGRLAR